MVKCDQARSVARTGPPRIGPLIGGITVGVGVGLGVKRIGPPMMGPPPPPIISTYSRSVRVVVVQHRFPVGQLYGTVVVVGGQ
jgi:hypothetical protein